MVRALVWVFISTQILLVLNKVSAVGQLQMQSFLDMMRAQIGSFTVLDLVKFTEVISLSVALFILAKRSRQRQIEAIARGDEKA